MPAVAGGSDRRGVRQGSCGSRHPLPAILATVAIVAGVYLLGVLAYRLRDIFLLIAIAGFIALVLNPFVLFLKNSVLHRRGTAVAVVVAIGAIVFLGLTAAFGYPLSNALAHLAHRLPSHVAAARQGHGVIGRIVWDFHLQQWVSANSPKLQEIGADLAKPAIAVGEGAVVLIGEMLAVLTLVVLLLHEGPQMRVGLLRLLSPDHAAWCQRVARRDEAGGRRVPLWRPAHVLHRRSGCRGHHVGAWLAISAPVGALGRSHRPLLQIGGALAGIPAALFAATQSLTDAAILGGVFIAYQELENMY